MKLPDIVGQPATTIEEHFPAANTAVAVTIAAATGRRHYVRGFTVSCNGTPATALEVKIVTDSGGTPVTLDHFYVPAAAFAPIIHNYASPLRGKPGKDVKITVTAPGVGISAGAVLRVYTAEAQ